MDLLALEATAQERLGRMAYDYYAGGADDEITVADNIASWSRLRLRPHVLRDVSHVRTDTTVLGTPVSLPVLIAPTAMQRMCCDEGEVATARAAQAVGTLMIVAMLGTVALAEVAAAAPDSPRWFQVYVHRDRGRTADVVRAAAEAGYRALAFTVDLPVLGNRRRDVVNAFQMPPGFELANLRRELPAVEGSGLSAYGDTEFDPNLTPDDIGWLHEVSGLPVVVKGVMRGDDAAVAVDAGAAAVAVSNHGGRQLDTAVAPADCLPEIVDAVGGRVEVYVDGGIRQGTDVVKALALGARAVLIGRPILWGLATDGSAGAAGVLLGFQEELKRAMALCGAPTVADLTPDLVIR